MYRKNIVLLLASFGSACVSSLSFGSARSGADLPGIGWMLELPAPEIVDDVDGGSANREHDDITDDRFLYELCVDIRKNDAGLNRKIIASLSNLSDSMNGAINKRGGKRGVSLLHVAASAGNLEVVKALVKFDANVALHTKSGFLPLYGAAVHGHDAVFVFLLRYGIDKTKYTKNDLLSLLEWLNMHGLERFCRMIDFEIGRMPCEEDEM